MSEEAKKRRGGWPKRNLRAGIVRLPPGVWMGLTRRARLEGKSRSKLIEEVLADAAAK